MPDTAVEIREFEDHDLEAVVEFALRAWEPVFTSVREVLGDDLFLRLHPDWRENQAEINAILTSYGVPLLDDNDRPIN